MQDNTTDESKNDNFNVETDSVKMSSNEFHSDTADDNDTKYIIESEKLIIGHNDDKLEQVASADNESNVNIDVPEGFKENSVEKDKTMNLITKQQSLEEELLMEDELLKGEDDEIDSNINTEDLMLDEDSTIAVESQLPIIQSVTGSVTLQGDDKLDLEINIDSLLETTSEIAQDNNLDVDVNEAELLNEDDMSVDKRIESAASQMVYDEDSLLRELDGKECEDVVLDENVESLLVGDAETIKDEENMSVSENATLLDKDSKDIPMDNYDIDQLLEDNSGAKDVAMELNESNFLADEDKEITMDENSLCLNDVDTGQGDQSMDENEDETPMEENELLKDEDAMDDEDRTLVENSDITIDESNLLDEESRDAFNPIADETSVNENILLSDTEGVSNCLNFSAENQIENNSQSSAISSESERTVRDLEDVQSFGVGENDETLKDDEADNDGLESMGFGIKIDSYGSANPLDSSNGISSSNDDISGVVTLPEDNLESNSLSDNPQTIIEECDDSTANEDDESDLNNPNVQISEPNESELNQNTESLIVQEELSLSNDFPENEASYDESLVKEEVLENEFEDDYAKSDEGFQGESLSHNYDTGDAVVKEEMADIETLVDVKQEVLEETDHLAMDHNIKQEYLDADSIKEEYSGDDGSNAYFNEDKSNPEVVPVALNKSSEFHDGNDLIVPASMISVADIKNRDQLNLKENEEIIISDKCVDVANLTNMSMDVENEVDSLLAPRSFACSICHREYQLISSLQRHEKIHKIGDDGDIVNNHMESIDIRSEIITNLAPVEGMYNCTCGKAFKRRSSVVACMKTHRIRGIWCEYCAVPFRRQRELRSHILRVHTNSKNKKPRCTICNKEFAHQRSLIRHSKLHLKDLDITEDDTQENDDSETMESDISQRLKCETCDLEFSNRKELSTHQSVAHPLTSTGDVPAQSPTKESALPSLKLKFNCKTCRKVFLTLGSLTAHKALHSKKGKMKFRCERCQESFQTRSELSSHRRLHCRGVLHHYSALQYVTEKETVRNSKQVKCNVCSQSYANNEEMEEHRDATHPFVTFSKEDATETRIFFK